MNKHFSTWQNKATAIWVVMVAIVAIIMALLWGQHRIHIQSDIVKLLPNLDIPQNVLLAQKKVNEQLNNKLFILLKTRGAPETLETATETLTQAVAKSELWQPVKQQDLQSFGKVLYQHRTGLLDTQTRTFLQQKNYEAVLEKSLLQLNSPMLPLSEQMLKDDPLLLFSQYMMEKSQQNQTDVSLEQGFLTRHHSLETHLPDGQLGETSEHSRLIVLTLTQSPYNIDYQEKTTAWLDELKTTLAKNNAEMSWTGTLAFASFGTQSAQKEISTIGLGSSIGVILLVLFGFRSLRPLLTEFIAVTVGTLMAFAVTHWLFGEIHLMTLIFGASLIGACVDFSFYFMAMQSLHREKNGFAILTPLLPSLFLGLMTTIIAYLFLSVTPFPAFRQISLFSATGLLAAWITSILLLPRLPALNAKPAIQHLRFLYRLRQLFIPYAKRRYALIALVLGFGAFGLSQIAFNDDIRNLQSADKQLIANDKAIRNAFLAQGSSEYFIVSAKTPHETEHAEAVLLNQLDVLQKQGKIGNVQAVGQWLNQDTINENIALLQQIPSSVLMSYAKALSVPNDDVLNWQKQLSHLPTFTPKAFASHPLAELYLSKTERVVMLHGVRDGAALSSLQTPSVYLMQPVKTWSDAFAKHRKQAEWLLLSAMVALAVLLGVLYGLRSVLPIMLPVTLALMATFALQALCGVELNLFSVMGCFLILGIGVDYAIFYRHAGERDDVVVMALFLCMLSTLLGFGLLAFSSTYAIFCFGLTVLCGVILSFLFATCLTQTDETHMS